MTRREFLRTLGAIPLVGFLLKKYTPTQLEEEIPEAIFQQEISKYCCYTCFIQSQPPHSDVTNFNDPSFIDYLVPLSHPATKMVKTSVRSLGLMGSKPSDTYYAIFYCDKHAPENAVPIEELT